MPRNILYHHHTAANPASTDPYAPINNTATDDDNAYSLETQAATSATRSALRDGHPTSQAQGTSSSGRGTNTPASVIREGSWDRPLSWRREDTLLLPETLAEQEHDRQGQDATEKLWENMFERLHTLLEEAGVLTPRANLVELGPAGALVESRPRNRTEILFWTLCYLE
jgi:hypothetical protein